MTSQELKNVVSQIASTKEQEEYSIPLCITDIVNVCREYNKLGHNIQSQVEKILNVGVEESIKSGFVKQQALPHIKNFLQSIENNAYFGEASEQAQECIYLIDIYYNNSLNNNYN